MRLMIVAPRCLASPPSAHFCASPLRFFHRPGEWYESALTTPPPYASSAPMVPRLASMKLTGTRRATLSSSTSRTCSVGNPLPAISRCGSAVMSSACWFAASKFVAPRADQNLPDGPRISLAGRQAFSSHGYVWGRDVVRLDPPPGCNPARGRPCAPSRKRTTARATWHPRWSCNI